MAKQLALRSLKDQILLAAYGRVAGLLRPYPDNAVSEELDAALAELEKQGLIHAHTGNPNLTPKGFESARALASKVAEKEAE